MSLSLIVCMLITFSAYYLEQNELVFHMFILCFPCGTCYLWRLFIWTKLCNADTLWVSKPTTNFVPRLSKSYAAVLVKKFSEVRSTNMIISDGLSSFSSDYTTWHGRMSV